MCLATRKRLKKRAFTLVELIVVIVVLGILASIAIVGYKTVVDKSLESKQMLRMTQVLKEAKVLYTQKTYTDPSYTWNQAVADAVDDLPAYTLNAWSQGVAAAGGVSLNAATNGWTVQTDTGATVFSASPNDIVVSTSAGVVYVASALSSTRGVFGMISATSAPRVWGAACLGSSCDAASASSGPPAGGAYAAGTTIAPVVPTISYASGAFSLAASSQVLSPTVSGSPTSYSYSGSLPSGVTFSITTGAFTGPASWTTPATQVVTGLKHSCALLSSGAVKCWGDNTYGQLGDGTTTQRNTPTQVSTLSSGVTQIAAGNNFTCALTSTGSVYCWGQGTYGQIGNSTTTNTSVPMMAMGLSNASSIGAGANTACAVLSTGAVKCWGDNGAGSVGDGTSGGGTNRSVPTQVSGLTSGMFMVKVGGWENLGYAFACALSLSGSLKCWGQNGNSQLGDGTTTNSSVPVQVSGLGSGVTNFALAETSACALYGGGVKCWGWGGNGQMGDGMGVSRTTPGNTFTSGATALTAGKAHFCAVVSGATQCWGQSIGGLGDNVGTTTSLSPIPVAGLTAGDTGVTGLSAGGVHTCVLRSTGAAQCWGSNTYGSIGDNTVASKTTVTQVSGMGGNAGMPAVINVTASNGSSASTSVTLSVS